MAGVLVHVKNDAGEMTGYLAENRARSVGTPCSLSSCSPKVASISGVSTLLIPTLYSTDLVSGEGETLIPDPQ